MVKKKLLFVVLMTVCFLFIGIQNSEADSFAKVSIDRVGQNKGNGAGHFSDTSATPVFTNKYFVFDVSASDQILATALTAVSLNKDVTIRIANDGLTINLMWIVNE